MTRLVRHDHRCLEVTISRTELECEAEDSIAFLDAAYDQHHDEFYLALANDYRRALGRPLRQPERRTTWLSTGGWAAGETPGRPS
jgi:hypothetical protein